MSTETEVVEQKPELSNNGGGEAERENSRKPNRENNRESNREQDREGARENTRPARPNNRPERPERPERRFNNRRRFQSRRKVCRFCKNTATMNYRDPESLKRFITERGKILPRRITGTCAKHQRQLALTIKRARTLALLPFVAK